MSQDNKSKAFDLTHDIALTLKDNDLSNDVQNGLDLIISLARHQFDVPSHDDVYKFLE